MSQAAVGYQLNTLRSHRRPRFVISGRQIDALQLRHYSWRAIARTLRVSYRTILRTFLNVVKKLLNICLL